MKATEKLDILRRGGLVRRYHTARALRTQTVGEHCYHMGVLYDFLCGLANVTPSARVHRAIRYHDTPEAVYGDIPSPAKRAMGNAELDTLEEKLLGDLGVVAGDLTPAEKWVLKFLDCAEGAMTCAEEHTQGNRYMRDIGLRYLTYIKEHLENAPEDLSGALFTTSYALTNHITGELK